MNQKQRDDLLIEMAKDVAGMKSDIKTLYHMNSNKQKDKRSFITSAVAVVIAVLSVGVNGITSFFK